VGPDVASDVAEIALDGRRRQRTLAHGQPLVEDRPEHLARRLLDWFVTTPMAELIPLPLGVPAGPPDAAADLSELAALVTPRNDDLPASGPEGPDAVSELALGRHRTRLMGF
jgi:hypothetical protein